MNAPLRVAPVSAWFPYLPLIIDYGGSIIKSKLDSKRVFLITETRKFKIMCIIRNYQAGFRQPFDGIG